MTPKEKAKELIEKFKKYTDVAGDCAIEAECIKINLKFAKQCALICVEEVINEILIQNFYSKEKLNLPYWNEVKAEIEKL
jgi:hypothetical protein